MAGLTTSPGKVRLVAIEPVKTKEPTEVARNKRFQDYISAQSLFRGGEVKTVGDLKARVREALYDAVLSLVRMGVREASKGKFHSGEALEWSRLDFESRERAMIAVLRQALKDRIKSVDVDPAVSISLAGRSVLISPNAMPAAFSIAAAREMVGQPFLRDHDFLPLLSSSRTIGPVHLIACQKAVTEMQAIRLLGFPDATVVSAPFGVYVADDVQKVQMILIANCRDESTTRHGVQRFLDWLEQTGEAQRLVQRAFSRTNIVRAISAENKEKPAKPKAKQEKLKNPGRR
jgi:hypothetical protein